MISVGFSNKIDIIRIHPTSYWNQCFCWVRSLNDHEWHVPPEHRRRDVCREVRGSMKMPLNRSDSDGEEKKTKRTAAQ